VKSCAQLAKAFIFGDLRMSRIANAPVEIPAGVEVSLNGAEVSIKGTKGTLNRNIHVDVEVAQQGSTLTTKARTKSKQAVAQAGTARANVNNMVKGVAEGFTKTLELNGTGYRAIISGSKLKLQLGYSHDIEYEIPKEVKIECPKQNIIKITSIHKEILGEVAAKIRSYRKPEPFKGKGIKYENEFIFRKEGKKK
jgi:large subunit ribosomal protein L6